MQSLRAVLALLVTLLPAGGLALMPPHIDSSVPPDGGVLDGDTLVFRGYTLQDGVDVEVVDAGGAIVPITQHVVCTDEGDCCGRDRREGDLRVGCCQQRCELRVTLSEVVPEAAYRATVLDKSVVFTAAPRISPLQRFLESPLDLAQFKKANDVARSGRFEAPAWFWRPAEKGFSDR